MQLGQMFRAQRLRMNFTQAQLAEQTQVEMDTIRALEAGKLIDEKSLMTLAAHLQIDPQDVFSAMEQTQQENQMQDYGRRAPRRAVQEPAYRMSHTRAQAPSYGQVQEESMPPRAYENEASGVVQRDYESASEMPAYAGRHAAAQREEYVSPIPRDEDERLLQEIRRQRRRQAYEGTMRTQRRMQDTARMQEILRQQAEAEERRQQAQRQESYQRPRFEEEMPSRFEQDVQERPMQSRMTERPVERPIERPVERPVYDPYMQQEASLQYPRMQYDRPVQEELRPYEQGRVMAPERRAEAFVARDMRQTARMPRMTQQPMQNTQSVQIIPEEYEAPQVSAQGTGDLRTYAQMLETAADIAQLSGRETVLEIGCGNGELTQVLAQRSRFVAVVDTSTAALEKNRAACAARGYANVDFLEGDARRLPIESGSFDVVYVHMLLHHVVSAPQVLMEARRVLKPGGCVVVTELMPSDVPAQQRIQNAVEVLKNPTHIGVIPMQDVQRMMQQAGLQVVDRRVLDQMWEFEQWVDAMGARERMEPLRALMRSFALQGNRAGMDLSVDKTGRMTFVYRWMYLVGIHAK